MWHRIARVVGALFLVAIGASGRRGSTLRASPPPAAVDADTVSLDSAYAVHSCAPNDGPAVTLYLGGRVVGSPTPQRIEHAQIIISIWQGWSTLAGRTFVLENYHGGGGASYCAGGSSTCDRPESARVSFDQVSDERLTGRVDITAHGYHIARQFRARHVPIFMLCG
jgi:hypothetical protein